jgi:hypothetical protein
MRIAGILLAAALVAGRSGSAVAQITIAPLPPVSNGGGLTCSDFTQDADGAWSPARPITLQGPSGPIQIGPGIALHAGNFFLGSRLAARLDALCR